MRERDVLFIDGEPVGVVASIAPWNGPFNLAMAKTVPALLAGCSVVFKPAPETPLDVYGACCSGSRCCRPRRAPRGR